MGRQRAEGRGQRARACWITTTFAAVPLSLHTHPSFSLTESICCQHASKCAQPTLTCCVMQMALRQVHYHTGGGAHRDPPPTIFHLSKSPVQPHFALGGNCWGEKKPPNPPPKVSFAKRRKKDCPKNLSFALFPKCENALIEPRNKGNRKSRKSKDLCAAR